ncbi:ABC transporter transmembrane domain-containing protein [Streptomyces sp. NBC_00986]|uniref:ABC transporter transmembrane domain-containing protein n=1 Tax=Streptomyces sp. NBC_00986 TaxID=2903702 RepID=UPI003870D0CC|nr:ABC transporter ATP-binding protein/permease [Streptomyces sp. NBC_00986]
MTSAPGTHQPLTPAPVLPVAMARQTRARLRDVLQGRWLVLWAAVAALGIDSALALAGPTAIGRITQAIAAAGPGALVGPVLLLARAAAAGAVTGWCAAVLPARLVQPVAARLRENTVTAALALPVDIVEAGGTGDLVSRVSGDVDRVSQVASGALGAFVAAALTIAATLVGLAALDWRFALAALLAVPLQAYALHWYLRTSQPLHAAGRTADGRRRHARVEEASAEAMTYELRATHAVTRFSDRLNGAELLGLSAVLVAAFVLVHSRQADAGGATTAALFFVGLFDPVNLMLGSFDSVQQAAAGLARIVRVTPGGRAPDERPQGPIDRPGTALVVHDVHHRYGTGPDVLHGVRLELPAGKRLAIVGATGSGKSTLASLVAGLRLPSSGRVTLGGIPPPTWPPARRTNGAGSCWCPRNTTCSSGPSRTISESPAVTPPRRTSPP